MSASSKPVAGTFCWVEVATTDLAGAKSFYSALFGWKLQDMPVTDDSPYTMAELDGKRVAGLTLQQPHVTKMGVPPQWLSYVAVDDINASTVKAEGLGARILFPPTNIGPGSLAVLKDPTDAVFAFWQSHQDMGTFGSGVPGALGWNELATSDVARARKFYSELFGWTTEDHDMGDFVYTMFKQGETLVAGLMAQPPEHAGVPSAWTVYFQVADADATVARAETIGGQPMTPTQDIPGIGRFAFLADPQGAAFALIQYAPAP
jgi:predicted enzyme related to lactoylglutathione lyase